MDAVLAETAPSTDAVPTEPATNLARWVRFALAAVIVTGLTWRLVRYLSGFPIWGDEAMLLLNILDRDYAGLTQHLAYAQVAPLLFLWLEKTALLLFGASEWSMHLFPALAGLAALVIFWRMARTLFAPIAAGLAVGILAVSYYPVRHACEVKPYAFDLFYAVLFAWFTLEHLRHRSPNPAPYGARLAEVPSRWLIALVLATPFAVFSSYPSVFVGGAVSLVLLPTMRSATWTQRGLFGLYNIALIGSFFIHYAIIGHQQIDAEEDQRTREFLREYWKDAFPPDAGWRWPIWLVQVFTGNMLAYPFGAARGGSTLTFLLVLLGSVALWRNQKRALLALCWLPFALTLVAAILGKYPFGGSARITQHLAPFICILMAHGFTDLLDRVRTPSWRTRLHLAFCLLLLGCGVVGIARDLWQPFKTEHDRNVRRLAREFARQVAADEPVVMCHRQEKEVLAEIAWYFRTEMPTLRWLPDVPTTRDAKSCWLVLCGHQEPTVADVIAASGMNGWREVESDVRLVPPENAKMSAVYCRKVRLMRE